MSSMTLPPATKPTLKPLHMIGIAIILLSIGFGLLWPECLDAPLYHHDL